MTICWCGSENFLPFSPEYAECGVCHTLVSLVGMSPEELTVSNDETDFYGKAYWLGHQSEDLGFPDIHKRARVDLTERNLHWLKALLKYRLPGAKVMELGCSHGSFVALMHHSGYDASGVEMSPWVVEFGKETFKVPIFVGPVENLDVPAGSVDVIALMDVMEHLPEPVATMAHCLKLLKPDGIMLIQTPKFVPGMNYAKLIETNGAFLEQLKADEHLYLFTEDSATRLFRQIGADHIQFEPAIFSQYDMFFAVSRVPLQTYSPEQINSALFAVPNGRMTLALLDLRERELASESDRIVRGEQIDELTRLLKEVETDRAARGQQLDTLSTLLNVAEADRAARGSQLETLTKLLQEAEADREARGQQIEALTNLLREAEADRAARGEHLETLTNLLQVAEADRAARGDQIIRLTEMLKASEAQGSARAEHLAELEETLKRSVADGAAKEELLGELRNLFHHRAFHAVASVAGGEQFRALEKRLENKSECDIESRIEKQ
jgi:2-polyprenyl-3-methyl-5-hydroxy-6-metoxy-1,4-benzoquinol methylase